jgi:hypothetical protein
LNHSPSIIDGYPLRPALILVLPNLTSKLDALILSGNLTKTVTSSRDYIHSYLSVTPPFPALGYYLLLFLSLSSPSSVFFSSYATTALTSSIGSPLSNLFFLSASSLMILSASSSDTSSHVAYDSPAFPVAAYFFSASFLSLSSCNFFSFALSSSLFFANAAYLTLSSLNSTN